MRLLRNKNLKRFAAKQKPTVDLSAYADVNVMEELNRLRESTARDGADLRDITIANFLRKRPDARAKSLDLSSLNFLRVQDDSQWDRIPSLEHNLHHIVEKPGIYKLEEMKQGLKPGSHDFLRNIPQPADIDFSQIPRYTPPSQDKSLLDFAKISNSKYLMATSSIANIIAQVYYHFSCFNEADYSGLPTHTSREMKKYMNAQRKPSTSFLREVDPGVYALDGDSGVFAPYHQILMDMGNILEKLYTLSPERFNGVFLKSKQNLESFNLIEDDYHRFMRVNDDLCLRSQIDCHSTLPNGEKIVYEIKTRATAPIRYEVTTYKDYLDYKLDPIVGTVSSYEREYYDLIRGGFMKYFFQLKIGDMDGALIGYHNTVENFGFEYVKRSTIEKLLFGNEFKAQTVFLVCSKVVTTILDEILKSLKGKNYSFIKLGYGAMAGELKLVFTAELYENEDYDTYKKKTKIQTDDLFEISHYYKTERKDCKVYKYEVRLFPRLNGVYNSIALNDVKPGDQLEIDYTFDDCGLMDKDDYIQFLLNAYKSIYGVLELRYGSGWYNTNQIYSMKQ